MWLSTTDPFFLLGLRFACPRWGPAPTPPRLAGGAASPGGGPTIFLHENNFFFFFFYIFNNVPKDGNYWHRHTFHTKWRFWYQNMAFIFDHAVPSRHFGDKQKKDLRECNSKITTPFSVCNKVASFVSCVCASKRRKPLRRGNGFS